jgi:D-glycero-alpha-D-manno-heptose 1-phosphate guanylyltransferase
MPGEWSEGPMNSPACAIILAGGLGTRLRSLVSDVPKPMASVGGRPFLAYLLDHLEGNEIQCVILAIGYKHKAFREYFGAGYRSIRLTYFIEPTPLGTGGALRRALDGVEEGPILALNGDTFLAVDYGSMLTAHLAAGARLTVALRQVPDASRYGGAVVEQGRIIAFSEKSIAGLGWINAGVYILERNIFASFNLPEVFSFERDFLQSYCRQLRPLAYPTDASFIDIGTPEDYLRVKHGLSF